MAKPRRFILREAALFWLVFGPALGGVLALFMTQDISNVDAIVALFIFLAGATVASVGALKYFDTPEVE